MPALVVFQIPPAAPAMKNVFDGLGMPATLEVRPPMLAGPMSRSISPLVLYGALVLFSRPARAQARPDRPETPPPEVRTSVTVQRTVQPDLATVTVGLAADGVTPAQAGSRLALRVDSLRRALATLGIPRDSVVNRSRWYWWRGRMEIIPEP